MKKIRFYFHDGFIDYSILNAWELLRTKYKKFNVFIQGVNPVTDLFLSANITFFPNPQNSFSNAGVVFMAEHDGMAIKIPSDLSYYGDKQAKNIGLFKFQYDTSFIIEGEYVTKPVIIDVSTNIRIDMPTPDMASAGSYEHYFKV